MVGDRTDNSASLGVHRATWAIDDETTPEVSTEDVRRIVRDGGAMLLDTRKRAQFEAGHIEGAINVDGPPEGQVSLVERLVGGNKAKALALYCNGPYCRRTRELARELTAQGFTNVSRYQLGIPIWRALGGPTIIELAAIRRIHGVDRTAVYFDARPAAAFAAGHLPGAVSLPIADVAAGRASPTLPESDFNTRIVVYGTDGTEARALAEVLGQKPCHNVTCFMGTYAELAAGIGAA